MAMLADAEAIVHRQGLDALADKFHRLLYSAPSTPIMTDEVQNDVLAADGFVQLDPSARTLMAEGTLNQAMPCCHAGGHIGGADAGGERAQRTVGTGVAVRADDAVTRRSRLALFGQQRVLNAHARPRRKS